jgi:hypothetical protein
MHTIRRWEHHMIRWMYACRPVLGAKDAQSQVKKFKALHRGGKTI